MLKIRDANGANFCRENAVCLPQPEAVPVLSEHLDGDAVGPVDTVVVAELLDGLCYLQVGVVAAAHHVVVEGLLELVVQMAADDPLTCGIQEAAEKGVELHHPSRRHAVGLRRMGIAQCDADVLAGQVGMDRNIAVGRGHQVLLQQAPHHGVLGRHYHIAAPGAYHILPQAGPDPYVHCHHLFHSAKLLKNMARTVTAQSFRLLPEKIPELFRRRAYQGKNILDDE